VPLYRELCERLAMGNLPAATECDEETVPAGVA
jgi:hypothetical protein